MHTSMAQLDFFPGGMYTRAKCVKPSQKSVVYVKKVFACLAITAVI